MSLAGIDWTANMATGHARVVHRHLKGEEYCRAVDLIDGVEYSPPVERRQALLHARMLQALAGELIEHLSADVDEATAPLGLDDDGTFHHVPWTSIEGAAPHVTPGTGR